MFVEKDFLNHVISEDMGNGDLTASLLPEDIEIQAKIINREPAVVCGITWATEVLQRISPQSSLKWAVEDGKYVEAETTWALIHGQAKTILSAERTILNFLQTLSGTATKVRHYVNLLKPTPVKLLDTRKTIPGLRKAQKYAVKCGGGENHRFGLYDSILIKENHITAYGNSITSIVKQAQKLYPDFNLIIEVENLDQLEEALFNQLKWIMLDNFPFEIIKQAVKLNNGRAKLEVSGGINENSLLEIAHTGVDYISVGALTKHLQAIDLSMLFI